MASSSVPHLRLTVEGLPRPDTLEAPRLDYRLEERGRLPFIGGSAVIGRAPVPLPLELLPELSELDLESDEEILGFVRTYGPLGAWPDAFRIMREEWGAASFAAESTGLNVKRLIGARRRHAMWGSDPNGEFIDEFRIAAAGLVGQLATLHELEGATFSGSRLSRSWPRFCPWWAPTTKAAGWMLVVGGINGALASASLGLGWVRDSELVTGSERGFRPGPPFAPVVCTPDSLYGLIALELADHVLAGRHYRICANETCGRLFSVQEGRAQYRDRHRTDNLKYHTPACKDAQAAREYRRRKATKGRV